MTTMTIQIENPSIIPSLRKVLSALEGVTIAKPVRKSRSKVVTDVPNSETLAAMHELESGHNAGVVKMDSVDSFVSSLL